MEGKHRIVDSTLLLIALLASVFFTDTARAQGQSPAYVGEFTLAHQIYWGKCVLQPGNYTITIKSIGNPTIALIRNIHGDALTYVVSGARSGKTNGANALVIKQKDGQFHVHSLALADLGMVLIYDPTLARETVQEARAGQTVPVRWVKK